jgi:hypothetical protein
MLEVQDHIELTPVIDVLLLLSVMIEMVGYISGYVALLCVIGSRWRFVVFVSVVSALREGGLAGFTILKSFAKGGAFSWLPYSNFVNGFFETPDTIQNGMQFAAADALHTVVFAVLVWIIRARGFWYFDEEIQGLITAGKKKLLQDHARDLDNLKRQRDERV